MVLVLSAITLGVLLSTGPLSALGGPVRWLCDQLAGAGASAAAFVLGAGADLGTRHGLAVDTVSSVLVAVSAVTMPGLVALAAALAARRRAWVGLVVGLLALLVAVAAALGGNTGGGIVVVVTVAALLAAGRWAPRVLTASATLVVVVAAYEAVAAAIGGRGGVLTEARATLVSVSGLGPSLLGTLLAAVAVAGPLLALSVLLGWGPARRHDAEEKGPGDDD